MPPPRIDRSAPARTHAPAKKPTPMPASSPPPNPVVKTAAALAESLFDAGSSVVGPLLAALPKPSPQDALRMKVDAYREKATAEYDVGGKQVHVAPHFRMSNGANGGAEMHKEALAKVFKGTPFDTAEMRKAVHRATYGRGSPDDVAKITRAL